jgi:type IV pilus assembly protein PilF
MNSPSNGGYYLSIRTITIIGTFILSSILLLGCAGSSVTTSDAKSNARALEDMGISLVRQGNLRGGLENLLKAAELDPQNSDLHHELAIVYRDLKEYDLSLRHFKRALSLRPKFPEAQNNLGTLYLLMNRWDLAIDSFQAAIDNILYQTPEIAYNNMGLAYYNKALYEKAIQSYQKALDTSPGYSACHANLGLVYETLNRQEDAINSYNKAIKYSPGNPSPYLRLGRLYYKLGKMSDASAMLKKFLSIAQEGPDKEEAQALVEKIESR